MPPPHTAPLHILAVASSGGHWEQLLGVAESFAGHRVSYMTTPTGTGAQNPQTHVVPDFNRHHPLRVLFGSLAIMARVWRLRPDIVVTTGAAPGLIALLTGRLRGARTVWLDSLANAETLSLSGRMARPLAHLCLTQYPHLATGRVRYFGAVL